MRKFFLSLLAVMLFCVLPAKAAVNYSLQPVGFEDGTIPTSWTQEHVSGSIDWVVEGGADASLLNPAGAATGDFRLAARSASATSTEAKTKLILPAMDFTDLSVFQPRLEFSMAQVARSGYFDTLRVYYRTSATTPWVLLKEYDAPVAIWTRQSVVLDNYASVPTYQVAFEFSEGSGRGIVLDDIAVRSTSQCRDALFLGIMVDSESAMLMYDGDGKGQFEVVVSTEALADPANADPSKVVFQQTIPDFDVTVTGLSTYTQYFAYLRTTCPDNETGYTNWVDTTFKTMMSVNALPFVEKFNQSEPFADNNYGLAPGWTFGGAQGAGSPFVYRGTSSATKNAYSVDSTAFLAFAAAQSSSPKPIEAGKYQYAASPEIYQGLAGCQVDFWATAYDVFYKGTKGSENAAEITVGVMEDPSDWSTFTAVQTVKLDHAYQFKHFFVSLASYVGTAKYVALASNNASKPNLILIDNFRIQQVTTPVPSAVSVQNLLPTSFDVFAQTAGAFDVKVFAASAYVKGGALPTATPLAELSAQAAGAAAHVALDPSLQGQTVIVYVGQDGQWAFPVTLRVPTTLTVPGVFTFNAGSYTNLPMKSLGNEIHYTPSSSVNVPDCVFFPLTSFVNMYPQITTSKPVLDGASVMLNGIDNYMVFPYVEDLTGLEIYFRLTVPSSYASYAGQSRVAVGVMTDPYDLSTFVELGQFDGGSKEVFAKCEQDFASYSGNGHYVAIRAIEPEVAASTGSYNAIDNVQIREVPSCREALHVTTTPAVTAVDLTWNAAGMNKWIVSLFSDQGCANKVKDTVVLANSVKVDGLTPQTTYYLKVHTVCGQDTVWAEDVYSFKTNLGVPYYENFDENIPSDWSLFSGKAQDVMAGTASLSSTSSGWMAVPVSSTYPATSGKAIGFEVYSVKHYWAVSPEISLAEIDASDAVRLSFDYGIHVHNNTSYRPDNDDYFMVLVSTDGGKTWPRANATIWANDGTGDFVLNDIPTDRPNTFDIDLTSYIGQNVKIAFYAATDSYGGDWYQSVDNVSIKRFDINCQGLKKLQTSNITATEASIIWTAVGTQAADLTVATDAKFANVVANVTATPLNPYLLSDLTPNTEYFVRARQTCDVEGEFVTTSFRTACAASLPDDLGTMTFTEGESSIICWTVGIKDTVGIYSSAKQPYVSKVSSFGNVLLMEKKANTSSYNYGNNYYAILPELDVEDISQYQVSFTAATNSKDGNNVKRLYVGVLTDMGDFSTFLVMDTISLQLASDSLHMKSYTVPFDTYEGDYMGDYGRYIMFQVSAASDSCNVALIDNVVVEAVNGCHQVTDMEADEQTTSSAHLFWTGNADEYEVVVTAAVCNPDTMTSFVAHYENLTSPEVVVTGLSAQTTYYAYVRGFCGSDGQSKWSGATMFMTSFGVPFNEPFNDTYGWTQYQGISYNSIIAQQDPFATATLKEFSNGIYWSISNSYNQNALADAQHIGIEVYSSCNNHWLLSPIISIDDIDTRAYKLQFSFDAALTFWSSASAASSTKNQRFYVMFSEDEGKTWRKENTTIFGEQIADSVKYLLSSIPAAAGKNYKFNISKFAGKNIQLAFGIEVSSNDNRLHIDNVKIDTLPLVCSMPEEVSILTNTRDAHVVCALQEGEGVKDVQFAYGTGTSVAAMTNRVITHDLSAVLTGLNPLTTYNLFARTICAPGDTSAWFGPVAFTTKCEMTAPAEFTFDNYATHTLIPGSTDKKIENHWTSIASASSYLPQLKNDTTSYSSPYHYSRSAKVGLYLETYSGSNTSLAVMPYLVADMDTLMLTFWARAGYQYGSTMSFATDSYDHFVLVGTMENPDDVSTFQLLQKVELEPLASYTSPSSDPQGTDYWRKQQISLEGATGHYIAFYVKDPAKSNYICIDDVTIEKMGCPLASQVHVTDVSGTSAVVRWEASAPMSLVTVGNQKFVVAEDTLKVSNLRPGTVYSVSVATICDNDTTTAAHASFHTSYELPFSQNFDDYTTGIPADWATCSVSLIEGNAWVTSSNPWTIKSEAFKSYHLHINTFSTNKRSVATPTIFFSSDGVNPIELSFKLALTKYNQTVAPTNVDGQKFAVLVSTDEGATWTVEMLFDDTDASAFATYSSIPTTLTDYTLDLSKYAGQSVMIAFEAYASISGADNDLHLDDVAVKVLNASCVDPSSLAAEGGDHQITLSWNGDTNKPSVIEVATVPNFATLVRCDTIASGLTHVVTGLPASTSFYARVMQICASGNTEYTPVAQAETDCDIVALPWTEGFETYSIGSETSSPVVRCWETLNTNEGSYPYAYVNNSSSYVHTGNQSLYFKSSSQKASYVILPEFDTPINSISISFACKFESTSSSGHLHLGYLTDPTNDSTFVAVEEVARSTSWQTLSYYLVNIPDSVVTTARLAFRYGGGPSNNYYMGIDDIKIEALNLNCLPPAQMVADTVGMKMAKLSWTSNDDSRSYRVELSTNSNFTSLVAVDTVDVATATFSGLQPNTTYYARQAVVCAEGISDYAKQMSFTTKAGMKSITSTPGVFSVTASFVANEAVQNFEYVVSKYTSQPDTLTFLSTVTDTIVWEKLKSSTSYYLYVRATTLSGDVSEIKSHSFTTKAGMKQIVPILTETTSASFRLVSADTTLVGYQYGLAASFSANPDTIQQRYISTIDSVSLTGLLSGKSYAIFARAFTANNDTTEWKGLAFKTPYGVPFVENFTSSIPTDWEKFSGAYNVKPTTTTSGWRIGSTNISMSGNYMEVDLYSSYKYWLATPTISMAGLEGQIIRCTFDFAIKPYYDSNPINTANQEFRVLVSTDNGATWSSADKFYWSSADLSAMMNQTTALNVNLSRYAGKSIRLAFYAGQTASGPDNYIGIDNVNVDVVLNASCDGVSAIKGQAKGANSIDLKITSAYLSDTIEYVYGIGDFVPSEQTASKIAPVAGADTYSSVLTGLEIATEYNVYARALCQSGDTSAWFGPVVVSTPCQAVIPYANSFDVISDSYIYENTYDSRIMNCWMVIYDDVNYSPYIVRDTLVEEYDEYDYMYYDVNYDYSHSTTGALNLCNGKNMRGAVVSPYIENLNTLQLSFQARPGYANDNYLTGAGSEYLHTIKVGCVVDPSDLSTFQLIDVVTLETASGFVSSDPEGNQYWRPYEVPLASAQGNFLVLMVDSAATSNVFYLDDMVIEPLPNCNNPTNVVVKATSATTALLTWEGTSDSYVIEVTDASEAATNYTTTELSLSIANLEPGAEYTFRVQGVCDNESSKWSKTVSCTLPITIPYYNDFEDENSSLENYKGALESILAGEELSPSTYGWSRSEVTWNTNLSGYTYMSNIYSSSCYKWFVSPVFDLTTVEATAPLQLSFLLAASTWNAHDPLVAGSQPDDKFAVVISEDGGHTWTADNVTLWDNQGEGQYVYDNIPAAGQAYQISLQKYAGKIIQIGFYGESTLSNGDNRVNIDDIEVAISDPSCGGVDSLTYQLDVDHVTASWRTHGNDSVFVKLTTSNGNVVYQTTTADTTIVIPALASLTDYTLSVQQVCGSKPVAASFKTACMLPFVSDMSNKDVWTSKSVLNSGNWNFSNAADNQMGALKDTVAYFEIWSTYCARLITPSIQFSHLEQNEAILLDCDMAMRPWSSNTAPGIDDTVRVEISVDGGLSWQEIETYYSDGVVLTNGKQAIPYNNGSAHFAYNLSRFEGQTVEVAFYAGSRVSNADGYILLDNVNIHKVTNYEYSVAVCNSDDYVDQYFNIPQAELVAGETNYTTLVQGQQGQPDMLVTLNLTVSVAQTTELLDTICEGYAYEKNGFSIDKPQTKTYPYFLTSVNGCDSLVNLHLTVVPTLRHDTVIKVCRGSSFTWNGETVYNNHTFIDTLNAVNGCDSIVTTYVQFSKESELHTYIRTAICEGDSYTVGTKTFNAAGHYVETLTSEYGCDSIVTLDLLVAHNGMIEDEIAIDQLPYVYAGNELLGVNVQTGEYEFTVATSCGNAKLYVTVVEKKTDLSNTKAGQLAIAPNPVAVGQEAQILTNIYFADDFTLTIYDAVGRAIYESTKPSTVVPGMSAAGIYTVRVISDGSTYQAKLVVK